jgi:hypothetical protein
MNYIKILPVFITILLFSQFACKKDCPRSSNCDLEPHSGVCMAYIPQYYFDKQEGKCKEFIWGGCEGVVPFQHYEDCQQCECNH